MEEYEVDLRDYLEVIWKRKWIITLVTVVALGVAASYSYTQPNEYRIEGIYKLAQLPQIDSVKLDLISKEEALVILNSRDLAKKVVAREDFDQLGWSENIQKTAVIDWIVNHLSAENPSGDLIEIRLTGAKEPQLLQKTSMKVVNSFKEEIASRACSLVEEEMNWLSGKKQTLLQDQAKIRDELNREIKNLKSDYEDKIEYLKEQIQEIENRKEYRNLKVGEENATLMGFMLRKQYDSLNDRLHSFKVNLDRLKVRPRQFFPELYRELDSTEDEIKRVEDSIDSLDNLKTMVLKTEEAIVTFDSPYRPSRAIGPNRKMNVAVAGVLGLFLGTLLAFFWEYMSKPPEKDA